MTTLNGLRYSSPYIIALIVSLFLSWQAHDVIRVMDAHIGDKAWQWIASESKEEQRLIIVDIDEASIARHGAWPWTRKKIAKLSSQIAKQGASMQIFDMVFTGKKEGDEALVVQLKSQQVVLAQILAVDADDITQTGALVAGSEEPLCHTLYPQANASIANNAIVAGATHAAGHITPSIDSDGVVRRMPAFICQGVMAYPALMLSALANGINQPSAYILEENTDWLQSKRQLKHAQLPEITIPLNKQGEILLPWWLSRDSLISLSASDLLEGKISSDVLDGAWVLIGSTAFGGGDSVSTPQAGMVGGVEVHAQLLSALLDNKLPYQPQGANTLVYLWMMFISIIMLLLFSKIKGRFLIYGAPLLGVLMALLTIGLQAIILKTQQMWIPSMTAVIFAVLSGAFITIKEAANNWVENKRLYLNLASYLPEHAAKWIAKQDPVSSMDAHAEKAFVMYVDLRNFSNWCNQLPAEQVGAILHTFYKVVTDIVQKQGGQTEKYVGDAVMCVWRGQQDSILIAAQELVDLIDQQFGELQGKQHELPPLALGIGIEYGEILVATLGPAQRREYTVIGNTVTTAIQLQEMTTELALPILIGKAAADKFSGSTRLETQGAFLLAGAQQSMEIFTPQ